MMKIMEIWTPRAEMLTFEVVLYYQAIVDVLLKCINISSLLKKQLPLLEVAFAEHIGETPLEKTLFLTEPSFEDIILSLPHAFGVSAIE